MDSMVHEAAKRGCVRLGPVGGQGRFEMVRKTGNYLYMSTYTFYKCFWKVWKGKREKNDERFY